MRNSFYKIKKVKSRFLSGKNIYRIILIFNFQYSIFNFQSFAQTAPGIEWQNTIGGGAHDYFYSLQLTTDNGFILIGSSYSNISGDKTENSMGEDYWVVKTNSTGNIEWQNTIGGSGDDILYSVEQTFDGGYILGGASNSNISGDKTENCIGDLDYWIVKIDSFGNLQWQNTIGGSGIDILYTTQQTFDGGYILGGASNSNISGDKTENSNGINDYWIVKTDSLGNIQWQNTIGGSDNDILRTIKQTTDGGFILGGWSGSDISGDKTENSNGFLDFWLVKTDTIGNIEWQNTIGGADMDGLYSVQQTFDGGFILGGGSESSISGDKTANNYGASDYWIVKTDSIGNIQWQNTIGGSNGDYLYSIQQTSDSGYIIAGLSNSNISGNKTENNSGGGDFWIVKIDDTGNIQWQNSIGGSNDDGAYYIQQTHDAGYIIGGWSISNISGDKTENSWNNSWDYWIVKLFPDTITGIAQLPQLPNYPISISPNPLTTQSKLTFKNPNKEKLLFTLYDITGRVTESVSTTNNEIILTKGSKPAGVYLFNLKNGKTGEGWNGKIIVGK
jgi:hypothetical protein